MKSKLVNFLKECFLIVMGCIMAALAITIFVEPNNFSPGGATGLAIVINHFSGISVAIAILLINIPLFIMGLKVLGWKFSIKTIIATFIYSYLIGIFEAMVKYYSFVLTSDKLLATLFGGLLLGLGISIVFKADASTGGGDFAARIIHKIKPGTNIGNSLIIIDGFVLTVMALAFGNLEIILYSIVFLIVFSKTVDFVFEGINFSRAVYIISDKYDELAKEIMDKLQRGVTALMGEGMYTQKDKKMLVCIVTKNQLVKLKKIIFTIDDAAFISIESVSEVYGKGFKHI